MKRPPERERQEEQTVATGTQSMGNASLQVFGGERVFAKIAEVLYRSPGTGEIEIDNGNISRALAWYDS